VETRFSCLCGWPDFWDSWRNTHSNRNS